MVLTHPKLDYPSLITESIISRDFNASVTFLFACLENLIKYHKGNFAGHCFMLKLRK